MTLRRGESLQRINDNVDIVTIPVVPYIAPNNNVLPMEIQSVREHLGDGAGDNVVDGVGPSASTARVGGSSTTTARRGGSSTTTARGGGSSTTTARGGRGTVKASRGTNRGTTTRGKRRGTPGTRGGTRPGAPLYFREASVDTVHCPLHPKRCFRLYHTVAKLPDHMQ